MTNLETILQKQRLINIHLLDRLNNYNSITNKITGEDVRGVAVANTTSSSSDMENQILDAQEDTKKLIKMMGGCIIRLSKFAFGDEEIDLSVQKTYISDEDAQNMINTITEEWINSKNK